MACVFPTFTVVVRFAIAIIVIIIITIIIMIIIIMISIIIIIIIIVFIFIIIVIIIIIIIMNIRIIITVAMEFVLDVDERFFAAFAPRRLKLLVAEMNDLPLPPAECFFFLASGTGEVSCRSESAQRCLPACIF